MGNRIQVVLPSSPKFTTEQISHHAQSLITQYAKSECAVKFIEVNDDGDDVYEISSADCMAFYFAGAMSMELANIFEKHAQA